MPNLTKKDEAILQKIDARLIGIASKKKKSGALHVDAFIQDRRVTAVQNAIKFSGATPALLAHVLNKTSLIEDQNATTKAGEASDSQDASSETTTSEDQSASPADAAEASMQAERRKRASKNEA